MTIRRRGHRKTEDNKYLVFFSGKQYPVRRVKRLVRHHALERHVPRVGGEPRDALKVVREAEYMRFAPVLPMVQEFEASIVEALTHPQAPAGVIEAHQRQQNEIELCARTRRRANVTGSRMP